MGGCYIICPCCGEQESVHSGWLYKDVYYHQACLKKKLTKEASKDPEAKRRLEQILPWSAIC